MKKLKFTIPIYDWDVVFVENIGQGEFPILKNELKKYKVHDIDYIQESIEDGDKDFGTHLFNTYKRHSVIILLNNVSKKSRRNVLAHEKRHLEDRILNHLSIDDIEAAAYLSGYIAEKLY